MPVTYHSTEQDSAAHEPSATLDKVPTPRKGTLAVGERTSVKVALRQEDVLPYCSCVVRRRWRRYCIVLEVHDEAIAPAKGGRITRRPCSCGIMMRMSYHRGAGDGEGRIGRSAIYTSTTSTRHTARTGMSPLFPTEHKRNAKAVKPRSLVLLARLASAQ